MGENTVSDEIVYIKRLIQGLQKAEPKSRELSLAITKLEEANHRLAELSPGMVVPN